jgi:hypothetical protein
MRRLARKPMRRSFLGACSRAIAPVFGSERRQGHPPSLSRMPAASTRTARARPSTSTSRCRLLPLTSFPASSWPRGPPISVVFTDWLSTDKIAVDRLPWLVFMRQHAPLTPGSAHLENAVEDLAARVPGRLGPGRGAGTRGSRISHCSSVRSLGWGFLPWGSSHQDLEKNFT